MFCPQCGYRQASGEVQYCSSCGFPLRGVQVLLGAGGVPAAIGAGESALEESPRRRGVKQGVLMWIIGALLIPLLAILNASEEVAAVAALILFGGGLMRMIYARLFLKGQSPTAGHVTPATYTAPPLRAATTHEPPPVHRPPSLTASAATKFAPRAGHATGELVAPPSVTDHTTRLLRDEDGR